MIVRPSHLPDFNSPPLDEVVIGVQFKPPQLYTSVQAKDVWELFKDDYPNVQEQPVLEPAFETFGGSLSQPSVKLKFVPAPLRSRLWFISEEKSHLIQFQEDRFFLNWRKRQSRQEYPHFESIVGAFEKYLGSLEVFFRNSFPSPLDISQAEVSYINIIPVDTYSQVGDWFEFFNLRNVELEGSNLNFTEVINNSEGEPYARLTYELQSVITKDGRVKAFKLSLTFRGKPVSSEISEVIAFAYLGREKIVTRFKELTTEKAHNKWEIR